MPAEVYMNGELVANLGVNVQFLSYLLANMDIHGNSSDKDTITPVVVRGTVTGFDLMTLDKETANDSDIAQYSPEGTPLIQINGNILLKALIYHEHRPE